MKTKKMKKELRKNSHFPTRWNLAFTVLFLLLITVYPAFGQEDITETYLSNAGFDTSCNYLTGGTGTVATADPGNTHTVTGWTIELSPAWSAGATFEYGWSGDFNGTSVPANGPDEATGSDNGALGLTAGWSGTVSFTQEVTLPTGRYGIVYAVLFKEYDELNSNSIGWVPDSGSSVLSDLTSVSSVGEWYTDTVIFTLNEETTGDIQVGMDAYASGSTSNPIIFIDYVKLLSLEADKTELQTLVDSANLMLANPEDVPDGSTAYTDLSSAISNAQSVLDNDDATTDDIINVQDELEAAIAAVYVAIYAYQLENATYGNPVDVTTNITNPDFELNDGSTDGWTTGLDIYYGTNSIFIGAPSPNHVMDGDPDSTTTGYQTITGIPSGVYKVKAIARGRIESGPQMFIGADPGEVFGTENRSYIEVDRIGDTGGELDYGFNQYETPFVILPDTVNSITLGIYFSGDCGWSSVDNFELYYYGGKEEVVTGLKKELVSLRDSIDMPEDYDTGEIDSLLNVSLTSENTKSLMHGLDEFIEILQEVISANVDASLSDLKVEDKTIRNFSSSVYYYDYNIYSSTPQTPEIPTITAIQNSIYAADPVLDVAEQIPDTTFITVTAGNGDQKTYAVRIAFVLLNKKENYTATFDTYQNQNVEFSGVGQLTITGSDEPLDGSAINLVSPDMWIYFPNIRPSVVADSLLEHFMVYGEEASEGDNIRVAQYLEGTMVIPHSITYQALTVYGGSNLTGTSDTLSINQYYTTSELGDMNDNIESFKLKRGYMATFASNEDGTGISRVYIADKNDVTVNTMPDGLSNTASFVVVRQWRWTTKKAWRGSASGADQFGATSHYDYNNAAYSTLDVEYIPMRHNPGWNAYSNFLDKFTSTHALFYNEPDNESDDGYSTVADAIENYPSMMASGLRLGTPATTDGGLSWLYEFLDQCDALNYRVDFVAWHFYRSGYTAESLYNTLKTVHENSGGRPLWITEWNNGCNWTYDDDVPTLEENGEVIESFAQMMDTASFIERYFVWDGCNEELRMTNSSTGELYPAGIAYRDQVSSMSYTDDYYNSDDLGGSIIEETSAGMCDVDGTIDNTYSGYSGSGYLNTADEAGSGVSWKINFTSKGSKTLTFRYASTDVLKADLIINDSVVATNVLFDSTGAFTQWYKLPVTIYTNAGIADVSLEAKSSGGLPNIDYVQVTEATSINCDVLNDTSAVIIQENTIGFCSVDGAIETDYEGYTGDGVANTDDAFGRGINYSVYFTEAGDKNLRIRYASTEELTANLVVDGEIKVADFVIPSTDRLDTFDTISISFNNVSDTVALRLEATTADGLPNVDYIQLTHAVSVNCTSESDSEEPVLIHSYTFEDGTANDVVGSAHGTLSGGTIENGTYVASSQGDYITLPATSIAINNYSSITLEAYIEAGDANNKDNTKLSYFGGSSGENGINYLYTSPDSKAAISCNNSSTPTETETAITGTNINDGKKHHMALVITKSELYWYVDGELTGSTTLYSQNSISSLSNELAYIGKSGFSADTTWLGSIEEFNIYEGVMNSDTIASHSADYTLELRHSYTFDDGTADDVISGADGTIQGGEINLGSYRASSSGDYIELPADEIAINTYNSITLEALVKAGDDVNGTSTMLSYFGETVDSYGANYLFTSLKSRAAISCNNTSSPWSAESGVSSVELDDGGYYHLVVVLTNSYLTFYVNGVLMGATLTSSDNLIANLSNSLAYLCKSGYTDDPTWLGYIYEFNIYEGIMLSDKVEKRYEELTNATYTITYTVNDDENGKILGTNLQTVTFGDSSSSVTAYAYSDCYFEGWSDGVTTEERTELYVGADFSVTANFAKEDAVTSYSVYLTISDGEDPVEGVSITFDSADYTTDGEGIVIIQEVKEGEYPVVVTSNDYNNYYDTLVVVGEDLNQTIVLTLKTDNNISTSITVQSDNSIKIFPNPASSMLFVESDLIVDNVTVYNICGKEIFRKEYNRSKVIKLDVHDWEKGIYFFHISMSDSSYQQKLVVE